MALSDNSVKVIGCLFITILVISVVDPAVQSNLLTTVDIKPVTAREAKTISQQSQVTVSSTYSRPNTPACKPDLKPNKNITKIFFYHTRKAGGTNFRKFLDRIQAKYRIPITVFEGDISPDPRTVKDRSTTLFVTLLREPVSRIISSFKYEVRWNCRQLIKNHSFVPTAENAVKLEKYVYTTGLTPPQAQCKAGKTRVWGCAANCYISWFSYGSCSYKNFTKAYELARNRLTHYDLILLTERLQDPQYVKSIEQLFGVPWHDRRFMWCFRESKQANEQYPLQISNATLDNLFKLNIQDTMLYREFTSCPDGVHIPNISLRFSSPNSRSENEGAK